MRLARIRTRLLRALPIIEREMRIAARGKAAYRWRLAVAAIALGLMAVVSASQSAGAAPAQAQGATLFRTLILVSALYAFLASVSVTADSVSREKREGTLGLLFLTELRGGDIILGKLAANSLNTIYGLFGLLPLLAIPVMMGGVSITAGLGATVTVINLLFVSLSLGMYVSTISWDERRATFAAVVSGLTIMLGPLLLSGFRGVFGYGQDSLLQWALPRLSPLYPLITTLPIVGSAWSWSNLLPAHLIGWLLLYLASREAQSSWYRRSASPVSRTVDEMVFTPRHPAARARHREEALNAHPLVWLLERHPGKRYYADILVVAIVLIWAWGYRNYGYDMFGGPTWFLIVPLAFTVHLILATWVIAESSMRIIEDRRSGALELLLCTSLTDREIVEGHRLALRRLFLRPVLVLAAAEVFVAFTGFGRDNDIAARNGQWLMISMAIAIVADSYALSWIALRLATALPNVNRVGMYALMVTPFGPVIVTALIATFAAFFGGYEGRLRFREIVMIWLGLVLVVDIVVGYFICRRNVLNHFRESAVQVHPQAATGS